MANASISSDTRVGPVHLRVRDLARATAFYEGTLGLARIAGGADGARFGAGGQTLVALHERADAVRVPGTTGLYHFAILVPPGPALGQVLRRLIETRTMLDGAADHLVSEALYLHDPEGNGIEIYRDRPREQWPRENGSVRMATDPLDLEALVGEPGADAPWTGMPAHTTIGHIHLTVSDLDRADAFYVGILGFERVTRFGRSALFVSAGGYHHHIGLNTWSGTRAPAPPPNATGLDHFVVRLPDDAERERVVARVRAAKLAPEAVGDGLGLQDPFGNRVVLVVEAVKAGV